jgi:hypothetical protein
VRASFRDKPLYRTEGFRVKKIGRNEPCPCGSGKKYKSCCLTTSLVDDKVRLHSPRFRFEPGSYGGLGSFLPSISCLEQWMPDQWRYHFVLVRPHVQLVQESDAALQAEQDLKMVFGQGQPSAAHLMAESLKRLGYVRVADFKIVEEKGLLP